MPISTLGKRLIAGTAVACLGLLVVGCNKADTQAPAPAAAPAPAPAAAPAPAGSVSILEPANGATVSSPFKVKFGASGVAVAPAGNMDAGTGHHHLLINTGPIPAGQSIPADEAHLHYGKAQTEADITLPPGKYKLTAQFANGAHQSYGEALSATIEVTVK